ncbi:putative amino acid transporter [Myriangium duriaei CBS 260.36]|uniref:Amino acid transporter n=1 Tax=Myriangium duriaei CBS 260.36 TaxID=1168546 RepID=A0A9P4JCK0_9PEZI|nr:putative amino acid transporter [Myriangium duriaei CBS 260.36]
MVERKENPATLEGGSTRKAEGSPDSANTNQSDVFGDSSEDGVNYQNMGWVGTTAMMLKSMLGLGILSIPSVFNSLGLVPGLICLWTIALVTTWSGSIVGRFKLNHPEVYSIDDAGKLMFGKPGRIIFGVAVVLYWMFLAGSGLITLTIGLNSLSLHGTCTAVFMVVAALASFVVGSQQTLDRLTWLAWLGLAGVISSVIALTISVSLADRPRSAPKTGPWHSDWKAVRHPDLEDGISSVALLIFAYAGIPNFFSIISEMKQPEHYHRALIISQSTITLLYTIIGSVVYVYCGSYVESPAISSTSVTMARICYGLALPGLLFTTVFMIHVASKYVFIHVLKKTAARHIAAPTKIHWMTWLGSTFSVTMIAYLIASGIPVFSGLTSLIGALFGTFMTFQAMGCMWLYDNFKLERQRRNVWWRATLALSVFVIVSGCFLTVAGTYGSVINVMATYKPGGSEPWTCADNSGLT